MGIHYAHELYYPWTHVWLILKLASPSKRFWDLDTDNTRQSAHASSTQAKRQKLVSPKPTLTSDYSLKLNIQKNPQSVRFLWTISSSTSNSFSSVTSATSARSDYPYSRVHAEAKNHFVGTRPPLLSTPPKQWNIRRPSSYKPLRETHTTQITGIQECVKRRLTQLENIRSNR